MFQGSSFQDTIIAKQDVPFASIIVEVEHSYYIHRMWCTSKICIAHITCTCLIKIKYTHTRLHPSRTPIKQRAQLTRKLDQSPQLWLCWVFKIHQRISRKLRWKMRKLHNCLFYEPWPRFGFTFFAIVTKILFLIS